MTLANTSGSATATNSHPQAFAILCKKGDFPTGTYPVLKTSGGTTVPYTYWNEGRWSDGSLKILPCLARFPDAIAGSGSASLKVYNGGTSQSASAITLSMLYAENLTIEATGGLDNISGDWTVDIQSANVLETVVYGSGPAGIVWRLLLDFKQSGAAHGQLVSYVYIMGLQDASGNLAGWRLMPRVTQPWYNYDTPVKNYRSFTSMVLKANGSTICDPMANYSAKDFTWANSGDDNNLLNCNANGYTSGVAGRLTTNGTLPAGLVTGRTYWIRQPTSDYNNFYLMDGSSITATNITVTDAGTGVHTFTPLPYVDAFCSYWCATDQGRYVYMQGAGSAAAEPTILVQADKTYDRATKIIPPYKLSGVTANANTNYTWAPYQYGGLGTFTGAGGEGDSIGVLNAWAIRQFYRQTTLDERVTRIIGLAMGMMPVCFKDRTTKNYLNFTNSTSYTGMPSAVGATSLRFLPGGGVVGFGTPGGSCVFTGSITGSTLTVTAVTSGTIKAFDYLNGPGVSAATRIFFSGTGTGGTGTYSLDVSQTVGSTTLVSGSAGNWTHGFDRPDISHLWSAAAFPYMMFGEPQYYDILKEEAQNALLQQGTGGRNFTVGSTTYYGIGLGGKSTVREGAWSMRNLLWPAILSPDTDPDGSDYTTYCRAIGAQQGAYLLDYTATLPTYCQDYGFWMPQNNTSWKSSWQLSYCALTSLMGAGGLEDSNLLDLVAFWAKWPVHTRTFTNSSFHYLTYYEISSTNYAVGGAPFISSDAEWGAQPGASGGFGWSSGTNKFTWTTPNFTPTDGDKVIFWRTTDAADKPAGFTFGVPYYAVNTSGNTFELSATIGGSAITLTDTKASLSPELIGVVVQNPNANNGVGLNNFYENGGAAQSNAWVKWFQALGGSVTGLSAVESDFDTMNASVNWALGTKYYLGNTF